jgi:hypothetical protein
MMVALTGVSNERLGARPDFAHLPRLGVSQIVCQGISQETRIL